MNERATNGPAPAGPASGGSGPPDGSGAPPAGEERVVVRDNRKIDPSGTQPKLGQDSAAAAGSPGSEEVAGAADRPDGRAGAVGEHTTAASPAGEDQAAEGAGPGGPEADEAAAEETGPSTVDATPADAGTVTAEPVQRPLGAELDSLRAELDERTRDLQRLSAEYANYRKRVDRDRGLTAEQATAHVLAALLPVLDDLDRAREHGDLVGPFGAVAEQLVTTMGKFGLTPFGEKGDRFDPTRHEAVAHQTSAEVTEPTCIDVMRRGYLLGDRLLRPAMVAVADPE